MDEAAKPKAGFMYVYRMTESHTAPTPVYLMQLNAELPVQDQLRAAIPKIKAGHGIEVPPAPDSKGVEWRVASYAAFVMISDTMTLTNMIFEDENYRPHPDAFGEAKVLKGEGWSALIHLNQRKRKGGSPLGNRREVVRWTADHEPKRADLMAHNSSDTNVGP
ncbi:MAG TPA: hypothetical protein VGB62_08240 [Allosphingosinicella sp.]|jgi:hypothetical protein